MLIELAIGDAYGAGFEYVNSKFIQEHNTLTDFVKHPRHNIDPGCYTDDTQMSIAITELIISEVPWTPESIAQKFVDVFKRDPREGYTHGFYNFLLSIQDGREFLEKIIPTSDKSGAAMRAAPLGIYSNKQDVIKRCSTQAAVTHNTPGGINAAIAAALMTHYFIYKLGPKHSLGKFLENHVDGNWAEEWKGKVGAKGWMSVRAAITAVISNDRMSDILKDCISFTGDVDTVAAIALGAASCSSEIEQDLPERLLENLEDGLYGKGYLIELDNRLTSLIPYSP